MIRLILFLMFIGCGGTSTKKYVDNPPSPPGEQTWEDVLPIVQEQCALSGCHAGAVFISSGAAMKASGAAGRIANGSMPKNSSPNFPIWTDAKKSKLLSYLND